MYQRYFELAKTHAGRMRTKIAPHVATIRDKFDAHTADLPYKKELMIAGLVACVMLVSFVCIRALSSQAKTSVLSYMDAFTVVGLEEGEVLTEDHMLFSLIPIGDKSISDIEVAMTKQELGSETSVKPSYVIYDDTIRIDNLLDGTYTLYLRDKQSGSLFGTRHFSVDSCTERFTCITRKIEVSFSYAPGIASQESERVVARPYVKIQQAKDASMTPRISLLFPGGIAATSTFLPRATMLDIEAIDEQLGKTDKAFSPQSLSLSLKLHSGDVTTELEKMIDIHFTAEDFPTFETQGLCGAKEPVSMLDKTETTVGYIRDLCIRFMDEVEKDYVDTLSEDMIRMDGDVYLAYEQQGAQGKVQEEAYASGSGTILTNFSSYNPSRSSKFQIRLPEYSFVNTQYDIKVVSAAQAMDQAVMVSTYQDQAFPMDGRMLFAPEVVFRGKRYVAYKNTREKVIDPLTLDFGTQSYAYPWLGVVACTDGPRTMYDADAPEQYPALILTKLCLMPYKATKYQEAVTSDALKPVAPLQSMEISTDGTTMDTKSKFWWLDEVAQLPTPSLAPVALPTTTSSQAETQKYTVVSTATGSAMSEADTKPYYLDVLDTLPGTLQGFTNAIPHTQALSGESYTMLINPEVTGDILFAPHTDILSSDMIKMSKENLAGLVDVTSDMSYLPLMNNYTLAKAYRLCGEEDEGTTFSTAFEMRVAGLSKNLIKSVYLYLPGQSRMEELPMVPSVQNENALMLHGNTCGVYIFAQ